MTAPIICSTKSPLQTIAAEYASHGLGVFPALPKSKEPAGSWKAFQWQPPNDSERQALFSLNCNLNIGAICGVASGNLAALDCETPKAFEDTLRRVDLAGYSETWTVGSNRGGHIYLRLPDAVKPLAKLNDVEVRAQGQFILLPPSQHPNGTFYQFINRPSEIVQVESLRELDWLPLEAARSNNTQLPRTALRLLQGKVANRYNTRSEAEQAIITILVNASFTFDQILYLFRAFPAAGKFSEINQLEGPQRASEWLQTSFHEARVFCTTESSSRKLARETLTEAMGRPWSGRTGSIDKAVFCAHATIAYRSGRQTYHASSRELAEIAGCQRRTASIASRRLRGQGLLHLVSSFNSFYANRYQLRCFNNKVSENAPLPTTQCEGVGQTSSFHVPDVFRPGGFGRAAHDVITALQGESSVANLALRTGRHPQTVRAALKKMLDFGVVKRSGRLWQPGCTIDELEGVTAALGMNGKLKRQMEKHQAERLKHRVARAVLQSRKER